jgi:hypothetical protein
VSPQQELDLGVEEFVARIGPHLLNGRTSVSTVVFLQALCAWSEEAYREGWRRGARSIHREAMETLEGVVTALEGSQVLRGGPGRSKVTEP